MEFKPTAKTAIKPMGGAPCRSVGGSKHLERSDIGLQPL